ncbi:MAG: hypothetical protein ABL949_11715 [Fimbriimonadaceae bacterium]
MKVNPFRALLTASWVLFIPSMILSIALEPTLHPLLRDYLAWESSSEAPFELAITNDILLVVGAFTFIGIVVSYVGLYRWKAWARLLFVDLCAVGFVSTFFTTIVESGPVSALFGAIAILDGMLIAAMYWVEPIRSKFESDELLVEEGEN